MAILLGGVVTTASSQFSTFQSVSPTKASIQAVLVAVSVVPLACAFVCLEMWLKGENKDMFAVAFWMWVCVFMVPVTEILVPVGAALSGVEFSHMWTNVYDGILCYVAGTKHDTSSGNTAACAEASSFWWGGMIFIFAANVAMPMSTKHGSATLLWFVRALAIPLG